MSRTEERGLLLCANTSTFCRVLYKGDPEEFSSQVGHIIPRARSGFIQGSALIWTFPEILHRKASRRHLLIKMLLQLELCKTKEQWFYCELLLESCLYPQSQETKGYCERGKKWKIVELISSNLLVDLWMQLVSNLISSLPAKGSHRSGHPFLKCLSVGTTRVNYVDGLCVRFNTDCQQPCW